MVNFEPVPRVDYKNDYPAIFRDIADGKLEAKPTYRKLCKEDLFFLLYFGLRRLDAHDPDRPRRTAWVINYIQEVEEDFENSMDLCAREHYKSTVRTFALPIQRVIQDAERRISIFSHTRPIAKGFLREIKLTLEGNVPVKKWFPDIFYHDPKKQADVWSMDDGLICKRKGHPKESTFEAWGLVDGQPTSKHFTDRVYDDVVTEDTVGTPEQIQKVVKAFENSHSLGTDGGVKWLSGTHYHYADLYAQVRALLVGEKEPPITPSGKVFVSAKGYKVRVKPATDNGKATGEPVFLSQARLTELRTDQGPYTFSCQQLLEPLADEEKKFLLSWLKYYEKLPPLLNKYLLCDPANEKTKKSDFTVMVVIGVDAMMNRFWLDGLRDKLNLTERWAALRDMHKRHPDVLKVGYEKYGKDSDIQYFEERQLIEGRYFDIMPLGGSLSKWDRIQQMVPIFETGKFFLPLRPLIYKTVAGVEIDMVQAFINDEYVFVPFSAHDDIFDCIARSEDGDIDMVPPMITEERDLEPEYVGDD